jgi:hypothetical protein
LHFRHKEIKTAILLALYIIERTSAMMTIEAPRQKRRVELRFDLPLAGPDLFYPNVAAVELLPEFRSLARQMAPGDKSTQDDLVQEMALAALLVREPQTVSTYRFVACWRAYKYLRWWRRRMLKPDDKKKKREQYVLPDLSLDDADEKEVRKLTSPEIEHACEKLNLLLRGTREPTDEHAQQAT